MRASLPRSIRSVLGMSGPRLCAVLGAGGWLLCAAPAARAADRDWRDGESVAGVVRATEPSQDVGSLADRLAAPGPRALPALLWMLATRTAPGAGTGIPRELSPEELQCVREAFRLLPVEHVIAFLEHLEPASLTPASTRAALEVMGLLGRGCDLALVWRLAAPVAPAAPLGAGGPVDRTIRAAFESALDGVLARDPASVAILGSEIGSMPRELEASAIRAIGRTRNPASLDVLARLLSSEPSADGLILLAIREAGALHERPSDASVAWRVRGYLDKEDVLLVLGAVRAAAILQDTEAVPRLAELLDHDEESVRSAAAAALREITGAAFGPDSGRWLAWYEAETNWWRRTAPALEGLAQRPAGEAAAMINGLVAKHMFRHEITEALTPCLWHAQPDIVMLTCSVLGSLGSSSAIPALSELRSSADPRIVAAAERAIARIGGEVPGNPGLGPGAGSNRPRSGF